ncbi:hypothetical protein ARMSODRAFT_1027444 [Armillaria solidipes]|uniref:F-box domain-containing protein n=1 Tax=Armillaria solidipes TaxID=1076256 RepID=A0A2H3B048_9AGAR|nr:hypothetical protein ARMSODRAFT_1027444 [Armillaria solidipes]
MERARADGNSSRRGPYNSLKIFQRYVSFSREEMLLLLDLFVLLHRHLVDRRPPPNSLLSMESESSVETLSYHHHCILTNTAVGPHIMCSDNMALLRTGQSSEDLDSRTLASVIEHIRRLESEIIARHDEIQQPQPQALSLDARLQHEQDLAMQDLENHKSMFAPVRRLPNDVLLRIFQLSIATKFSSRCSLDVTAVSWLLGYICHHWRDLSRSSPSLWTGMSLMSECPSDRSPGKHRLLQNLLSLSRSSPLSINVEMVHPYDAKAPHHCAGDDRDIILEDIVLHSQRWSHINFTICGPVSALQDFSSHLPLLRTLYLMTHDHNLAHAHILRMFSSAPLLQDLAFSGNIVQWRELSRAVPLSQLTKLVITIKEPENANPDFYACVKEARALNNLYFHVSRQEEHVAQSSLSFDAQLFPTFVHKNIRTLTLSGEIPSTLDRCFMPNLEQLFLYKEYSSILNGPEVDPADLRTLFHFVWCSECHLQSFSYLRPVALSVFKGVWTQYSLSLTEFTITVTSATRADAVRELTLEEGELGILPKLQHLRLRTPEGVCIFQDDSLLKMASSRCTQYLGSFTLMIETEMGDGDVLTKDVITQMKRLREMKAITDFIPPEIIDAVIDCLRDDKDALLACSFVCRIFRPRTRVHLFHTLELKFNGTLNIDPDDPSFKRVIEYIKEIKLQGVVSPLRIPSCSRFLPSLPNLASLSLSFIFFRDPWHLHVLISHLPCLTDLDLKNVFFDNQSLSEEPSESEPLDFPTIKRISLYGTSFNGSVVESLFRWEVLRTIYVDSLHELRIDYPPAEYLSSICTFVRATSGSLKSFDIRFRYGAYTPGLWSSWPTQPDRLPLTMTTLRVEMKCDLYCDWHIRVMRWLVHSLSPGAAEAVRLETMMLTVIPPYHHEGEYATLEDEDWAAQWCSLDQALARPELSAFRGLKVAFKPYRKNFSPQRGPYSREWVKEKLSLLEKKGMLEVDIIGSCTL